jgi:hypothetical protein
VPASEVSELPIEQQVAGENPQKYTIQEALECWLSPQLGGSWTWLQPPVQVAGHPSAQLGRPYGWLYPPGALKVKDQFSRNSNCGPRLPLAWRPSSRCPLPMGAWPRKFDARRAMDVLSHFGALLFVGDSITEQHYMAFMSAIPGATFETSDSVSLKGAALLGSDSFASAIPIDYVCAADLSFPPLGETTVQGRLQTALSALESGSLNDKSAGAESRAPTVLVMNVGAHYRADDILLDGVNATLSFLRSRFPEIIIVWRATVPGAHQCERYFEPFTTMDQLPPRESWPSSGWPWNWGLFGHQNSLVHTLLASFPGVYFLDAVDASMLRPESRFDSAGRGSILNKNEFSRDCLHWCLPGPPDLWTVSLVELLALLVNEQRTT